MTLLTIDQKDEGTWFDQQDTMTETCAHTETKTETKTLKIVAISNLSTVLKFVPKTKTKTLKAT